STSRCTPTCGADGGAGGGPGAGARGGKGARPAAGAGPGPEARGSTPGRSRGGTGLGAQPGCRWAAATRSGRDEERRKLADIIHRWNANRLDMCETSQLAECKPRL
ncbi:Afadin, partial [Manis pentadactyla]